MHGYREDSGYWTPYYYVRLAHLWMGHKRRKHLYDEWRDAV